MVDQSEISPPQPRAVLNWGQLDFDHYHFGSVHSTMYVCGKRRIQMIDQINRTALDKSSFPVLFDFEKECYC